MSIEIPGLSARQIDLANRIWSMESTEEVVAFFDTLPQRAKIDAYIVYTMILWAWIDEEPITDMSQSQNVINYIQNVSRNNLKRHPRKDI